MNLVRQKLSGFDEDGKLTAESNFVKQFLTGEMTICLKNQEAKEEPSYKLENFEKLPLNIGNGGRFILYKFLLIWLLILKRFFY